MTRFLGYVVAGLVNGTIYALVALGVVVIYRISRVVNLAHGGVSSLEGGDEQESMVSHAAAGLY